MTNEEKQLLLKDLCARLPYMDDLKVARYIERDGVIMDFIPKFTFNLDILNISMRNPEFIIKPYLRPMSSMTEEEKEQTRDLWIDADVKTHAARLIDFYNKHHLDYRGLIPMRLALEAQDGMYGKEE